MRFDVALAGMALLVLSGCGGDNAEADPYASYPFEPMVGLETPPDVKTDRLCVEAADPDSAPDDVFIDCRLEGALLAPSEKEPVSEIVVFAYNMERGLALDAQIAMLRDDPNVPRADLMLVSEVDRGCSRSGHRNVPWEIAEALGMNYVFAVEFIELPRASGPGGEILETCEHGNAIFSRFPIGNEGALRHTTNKSWRDSVGEPRLGGRVLVYADVKIGKRIVHAYALHFESSPSDNEIQIAQAVETAEHGLERPFTVVQGGDTNAPFYFIDLLEKSEPIDKVTQAFFERGYVDAHAPLPREERETREGLVLDILFGRPDRFSDPAVCPHAICDGLSDHLAIWATLRP